MDSPRIILAETADFDLGGLRVSPAHREVRLNGIRHELEPRVTQVLVALASARSDVVSRDRLIEQCWDGRVVGDDAINRCIVALRHLAKEFSPAPFAIETVARVGYSLVERPCEAPAKRAWKFSRTSGILAALLMIIMIAGAFAFVRWPIGPSPPEPASIAVAPFRNLSGGQPYFAEGVGEEIISQLAREPQFRVVGRASLGQIGRTGDAREIGKQLGVDYVLEGSVATQGNRVRVVAGLVKASDGSQLWSNSYNGQLDDIFAIQQRIGAAIAVSLKRKLILAPVLSGPLVTNGDAYNLYLTARGLIRTRNRRVGRTASDLLRDAVGLDSGYAPAWAALSEAVRLEGAQDHESFVAATRQARSYARHALRLAPDLAEAHRVLATSLEYGSAEARAHAQRAAELEPDSPENLIELGGAYAATGNFQQEMASYRRAQELDPLWFRTVGSTAMTVAAMGERATAEAIARRGDQHNKIVQQILIGRIAWIFGDYSEAARRWSIVARVQSPRWSHTALRTLIDAKHAVGLRTGQLVIVPRPSPTSQPTSWRVWMDSPPDPATWRMRNRDPIAADVYHDENEMAAKLMLNAGRAAELTATYDGPAGLLGVRPGKAIRVDQLRVVPEVAMALRRTGRAADADQLLRAADSAVDAVYRRNLPPFWFDADAAAIWALRGKSDRALATLEAAWDRGWRHAGSSDLQNISDEPAFASLRGDARFTRIEAKLAAHYARERREVERLGI